MKSGGEQWHSGLQRDCHCCTVDLGRSRREGQVSRNIIRSIGVAAVFPENQATLGYALGSYRRIRRQTADTRRQALPH